MTTVAVVTGAGQGIGRAIARRLCGDGFAVALVDLNADGLAETAAERGRAAALALAARGITVNAVCPGVVDTAMTQRIHDIRSKMAGISPEESLRRMIARIPLGRIASPDDVARAVAFFCSPQAEYVTGQALNVCGGIEMD